MRIIVIVGVVCACSLGGGCRSEKHGRISAAALQVTDDLGRSIRLEHPARRIASLSPAATEIAFALGCGPRVVVRDGASDYPPAARVLPATNAFQISTEHIAGFRPDVVLTSHLDASRARGLEHLGFRVAVFDPSSLEGVYRNIQAIGSLCGRPVAARALVARMRRRIGLVEQRSHSVARPAVYFELDGSDPLRPWTIGSRSFISDVLRLAGGRNVFETLERPAAQVGAESILQRAPEVIVLNVEPSAATAARQAVLARAGWKSVPAVRQGLVIASISPALLTRPGPRLSEGVARLAEVLGARSAAPKSPAEASAE